MSAHRNLEKVPILLVDDRPANLLALEAVLESPIYELVRASSGMEALSEVARNDFAVILLDVQMPTMDGFETAAKIGQYLAERGNKVPIVFVTGIDSSPARILQAYTAGAVDFIQKPISAEVLRAKVSVFVELYRARSGARIRLQALTTLARELSPARTRHEVATVIIEHGMRAAQAETCTLYVLDETGTALELLGERGAPPEVVARIRRITEGEGNPAAFASLRAGTATWAESDADYRRVFPDLATLKADGRRARAFWSMPLVVEKRPVGLLGMGFYEPRTFSLEDRAFVEAFVMLCAQALMRALRFEREDRDRVRTAFLAKAGEALVSSLDYTATLRTVAQLAVPELADWCSVDLLEPGAAAPRQLAVAHVDPDKVESARRIAERYPPDPDAVTGAPQVIRSGRSELYTEIRAPLLEAAAKDAEHLRLIRELRLESAMVVPLRTRARTLGAISFIYADSGRRYSESDLAFAEDFARRAVMAIENALALKDAEDARTLEHALRARSEASERMFRDLVENLPELAWIAQADGQIDFYNRRWYEFTGTTFEEMSGWGWTSVHDPKLLDAVVARWKHCLATGESFEMEFPLRGADGRFRWFLTRVDPFRDASGRIVRWFGTNTDIDERRRNDEFRERFLGILGHDLRNPLGSIAMAMELLRRNAGERENKLLDRMASSSQRMTRMVEQILDLTRSRVGGGLEMNPVPFNLAEGLSQVVEELRVVHPSRHIDLRCPASLHITGDRDRLAQVFSNLVGNAVQHGQPTSPVTVEARDESSTIVISVHNDGPPIPDDLRAKLFDPFRRGSRDSRSANTDGLGLGLFISREIVLAHGGTLEVESSSADGTTFRVKLSRSSDDFSSK